MVTITDSLQKSDFSNYFAQTKARSQNFDLVPRTPNQNRKILSPFDFGDELKIEQRDIYNKRI
jgi:hypothetical protein